MCVCGQGVSLAQAKDKGQLIFLEGLKESLSVLVPQETSTAGGAMDFLRYTQTFSASLWWIISSSSLPLTLSSVVFCVFRDPASGLKSLYEFVRSSLSRSADGGPGGDVGEEWGPPVMLVDDVSVLRSLGVSAGAVLDFSHYCRATVCSRLKVRV